MNRIPLLLASAAIFAFAVSIAAQAADLGTTTKPPSTEDQASPPQAQTATPPQQATRPGTTSDQLSRSRGVIQPPSTGDHAIVPPPEIGAQSTPVIPPPGTPGGNPEVQPK